MPTPGRTLAALLGVVVMAVATVSAQTVSSAPDGSIELRAQPAPVGRVLRDLAALAPVRLLLDPATDGQVVSPAPATGLRVDQALEAVLSASKLPYLVWGGTKGPWRVVLGDEASAVEVQAAPAASAAAADGPPQEDGVVPTGSSEAVEAFAAREAESAEKAALEREAEAQPIAISDDASVPGGYTLTQENVTYNDPNFVPYKSRPEVQARRRAVDVTKIP